MKTKLLFAVAILALTTGCSKVIQPGHVGIVVNQYGHDRGVQSYTTTTGQVWYNPWTTSVLEYPTFVQTAVWTANTTEGKPVNEEITFTTRDKMKVDADISLAYSLLAEKVPSFYVKFRSDDLEHFTHGFLRNLAREKFDSTAGRYSIDQIMGDNGPFLTEVRTQLQGDLNHIGVKLEQFGFIGAPRPPKPVLDQINETARANQLAVQKQIELLQIEADAKKAISQAEGAAKARIAAAEGEAHANKILADSITPTLLELRRLEIQGRWNGQLPQYLGGSAPVPFINVGK